MAFRISLTPIALALAALACHAQDATQRITITGRSAPATPDVAGFGSGIDPLTAPMALRSIDEQALRDGGWRAIADLTRADPSLADAYNAEGYWSLLSIRGFTLDNRANYRRDGLPINAETALPLDNKSALELIKGTSGIQSGTSAPGGLVNLVVKRPQRGLRSALLEWRQGGSILGAVDLSDRIGEGEAIGWRLNAAAERLDPQTRDARGSRHLLALAGDVRLTSGTLLEAEVETSRQSQPNAPGFSLLGDVVPDARSIDPRTNLNNQAWSQPTVFDATTASLRLTQALGSGWHARVHAMTQHLRTDDRIAFPYGCSAEGLADRYCIDGSFDFYDFRSEGEKRRSDALDFALEGRASTGSLRHHLGLGVLATRFEGRTPNQAFNPTTPSGRIDGSVQVAAAPLPAFDLGARHEHGTEFYLRDRVELTSALQLWAGARHSRLTRDGIRQSFTTPWVALAWQLDPSKTVYASWGQGVETELAPSLPIYTNAGRALPALKSRQVEFGFKHGSKALDASLVAFAITRPQTGDIGSCDPTDPNASGCVTRAIDGHALHRGVEGAIAWRDEAWRVSAGALLLHARREGSADPAVNGLAPVNVPAHSVRAEVARSVAPGAEISLALASESSRHVLPYDPGVRIGGWARLDLAAKLEQRLGPTRVTWRAAIDNVADRRAWKESPYQFGHAYLFPLAPRSVRVSAQFDL